MKTFAIGDIHGAYKALIQCFERSGFDRENDRLIVLGDVCDGYLEVRQCIDELLKVKRCDLVIGNHDLWALDWALKGLTPEIWTSQGGKSDHGVLWWRADAAGACGLLKERQALDRTGWNVLCPWRI